MSTRPPSKSRRPAVPPGTVALIGAGPGDPGLLTLRAAELLAAAEVVVTDGGVDGATLARVPAGADLLRVGGDAPDDPAPEAVGRLLAERAKAGRPVVRLLEGDPLTGSPAAVEEADTCARAKVPVEVVPGLPTGLTTASYAGIPATTRAVPAVIVVSAGEDRAPDWRGLAGVSGTLVLVGPVPSVGKAATQLVEHGRSGDTPVAVITAGTTARQSTVVSTLDRVEADTTAAGLTGPATTVVGDVVKLRARLSWFETRPLFGWTVLVPRTRAQAGPVSARLRALGATPVEVPTIAVEPPRTPAPMERAIKGLVSGRYGWVAFTSTNAVKAVREKLEEVGLDARAFAGVKVAAIGEATAEALRAFGIRPDLQPPSEQTSEGLLAEWAPHDDVLDPIDRVFLPRADIATDTLVAGLKELGWAVDDITAYRTVRAAPPPAATREAIKTGRFDAALFTSSSTVRNLVGIAGKPHERTVIAAIGPQTAATARELGLRVDVLPETAAVEPLVDALAAFALARRLAAELAAAGSTEPDGGAATTAEAAAAKPKRPSRAKKVPS